MSLLSLVIPTKNRHRYLKDIIRSFQALNDERITLIIHDNSDTKMEIEESFKTENIKYIYSSKKLSMHQNFVTSLSYVNSKYVCISGDDDFLSHYISDILNYLEENNVDSIISDNVARYWWDDVYHRFFGKFLANQLRVPRHSKKLKVFIRKSKAAMNKCLSLGGAEIHMLPKVYHGITKVELLNSLQKNHGDIFPGPTPDMASAALISLSIDNIHVANLPFFISGTAGGSAGGKGVQKQHFWGLNNVPWFDKKYIDSWNINTPEVACGPTLWAEGVLQAHNLVNVEPDINWVYLYARTITEGNISFKSIFEKARDNSNLTYSKFTLISILIWYIFRFKLKRVASFLENISYLATGFSWNGSIYGKCNSPLDAVKLIKVKSITKSP